MEGRQRRSFTDDYKRQAVDLVASSGRSIGSVAKELGLRDSMLRRWVEPGGSRRRRRGAFKSVAELKNAIVEYLENHNADPEPFIWTTSAGQILEKVARAKQALESQH